MATLESDALVLRAIRYGEADAVLTVYTRERGRVSVMAKGFRKPTSRLAGRLQPGVWSHVSLHPGRGTMYTVRGAQVVRTHAGLWTDARRLQAAGCVLEAAMRVLPEEEANEEAFALLVRSLQVLAAADMAVTAPHLHPVVLGFGAKLLVVSGLLPQLASCTRCGAGPPFPRFCPRSGGVLCQTCADTGVRLGEQGWRALVGLLQNPLADAAAQVSDQDAALDAERVIGAVLDAHLDVGLRSATRR